MKDHGLIWGQTLDGEITSKQTAYEGYKDSVYPPGPIGVGDCVTFDKRLCFWFSEDGFYEDQEDTCIYSWHKSESLRTRLWFDRSNMRWYLQTMKISWVDGNKILDSDFMWRIIYQSKAQKWFDTVASIGKSCVESGIW